MRVTKKNMIESQLKPEGISCPETINCISKVDREDFVPKEFVDSSYAEYDIPLGNNYSMLRPIITAKILQLLKIAKGDEILEIGTGSGLISLCCLKAGSKRVVATDVNSNAIENASFNASHLGLKDFFEVRQVPLSDSSAFSVIRDSETFDLIISNPPWVNRTPQTIDEYALYDANFDLLKSLFAGLKKHLNPGGRVLLAYGCVDAIKTIQKLSDEHGFQYTKIDSRMLHKLPEEFLPGMMVQLQFPVE